MHLTPKAEILQSLGLGGLPQLKPDVTIGLQRETVHVVDDVRNRRELNLIQGAIGLGPDNGESREAGTEYAR
jgi:hypothetical protein